MSGEQHPPAVPELLHGAGYRHRWLLAFVQPVRFQNAQSWPYARQTQYQPKPNLQIQEFSQAPNEQENILVLRAPLRGKGDFQGIADDGDGELVQPRASDERIAHPHGETAVGGEQPRRDSLHYEYLHLHVGAAAVARRLAQCLAERVGRRFRNREHFLVDREPRFPETRFGDEIVRMHGIARIGHERVQVARKSEPFEQTLGDALQTRVFRVAVLEDVQVIGAVVNAGAEEYDLGRIVRGENELAHGRGTQAGLELEFRRQKTVKGILIQRLD